MANWTTNDRGKWAGKKYCKLACGISLLAFPQKEGKKETGKFVAQVKTATGTLAEEVVESEQDAMNAAIQLGRQQLESALDQLDG